MIRRATRLNPLPGLSPLPFILLYVLTLQTFNVLWATMGQYVKQGLVSDSRILDIKHVDISTGKLLENNVPVFLVTFASQEQLVFRSAKTGEVVVGSERDVEQCRYAMVLTRLEVELDNELTGGWKVVEVSCDFELLRLLYSWQREGEWGWGWGVMECTDVQMARRGAKGYM